MKIPIKEAKKQLEAFFTNPKNVRLEKKSYTYPMRIMHKVECGDGFTVSVQASASHYCSPREHLPLVEYSAFECGFPSKEEPLIAQYAENKDDPRNTVYGWVPKGAIVAMIAKHGGIK